MEALASCDSRASRSAACAAVSLASDSPSASCAPLALVAPHLARWGGEVCVSACVVLVVQGCACVERGGGQTGVAEGVVRIRVIYTETPHPPAAPPKGALCDAYALQWRVVCRRVDLTQPLQDLPPQVHPAHHLAGGHARGRGGGGAEGQWAAACRARACGV